MDNISNQLKYDAFISYRHLEPDQFVATNLHKKLERFKLPKSAIKLVSGEKTKIERVFRDEDELPLSDNLSDPIDQALSNTDFLIVICTPRLSQSRWCLREIETFLQLHDRKHILLVLAEGEPDESFPEILTYEDVEEKDKDGNIVKIRRTLEPLAADVRGKDNKERLKAMDTAVIKLAAAMFGLNFDDLKQRHREQRLRSLAFVWSGISAAILAFAIVCFIMLAKISFQKKELSDKYAGSMALAAEELLGQGRRNDALYAVRNVLPDDADNEKYNPEAYRMLTEAIEPYAVLDQYIPTKVITIKSGIQNCKLSPDGRYIVLNGTDGECHVFNVENDEEIYSFTTVQEDLGLPLYAFDGKNCLIYTTENSVEYVNLESLEETELYDDNGFVISDENCENVIVITDSYISAFNDEDRLFQIDLSDYDIDLSVFSEFDYGFSPDGKHLAVVAYGYSSQVFEMQIDTEEGQIEQAIYLNQEGRECIATDGDNIYLLASDYYNNDTVLYIIDAYKCEITDSFNVNMNFPNEVKVMGDYLVISNTIDATMLSLDTLEVVADLEVSQLIVDIYWFDDMALVINDNGSVRYLGEDYSLGIESTNDIFGIKLDETIIRSDFVNDRFAFVFDSSNYAVIYELNDKASYEMAEKKHFDYEEEFSTYISAEKALSEIDDIEEKYVLAAIYSSDKKYIFVMMLDGTARIYNSDNYGLVKVLYTVGKDAITSFVYIESEDIYVLNSNPYSYVLDENFDYIARLELCVGFDDDSFIVEKDASPYKVPYISYKKMIEMADEILGDYQPEDNIMMKYGIYKK